MPDLGRVSYQENSSLTTYTTVSVFVFCMFPPLHNSSIELVALPNIIRNPGAEYYQIYSPRRVPVGHSYCRTPRTRTCGVTSSRIEQSDSIFFFNFRGRSEAKPCSSPLLRPPPRPGTTTFDLGPGPPPNRRLASEGKLYQFELCRAQASHTRAVGTDLSRHCT